MDDIVSAAHAGWLQPEVIEAILTDPTGAGLHYSEEPPISPSDGQLYLFDQTLVKHYKQDGINWVKKKGSGRVQEVHQKITINGLEKITGFYSTSADDLSFRRRTYRLSAPGSSTFLVHYRKCERYKHAMKTESRYSLLSKQNMELATNNNINPPSDNLTVEPSAPFPSLCSLACVDISCCGHPIAVDICTRCTDPGPRNRNNDGLGSRNRYISNENIQPDFSATRGLNIDYTNDASMQWVESFGMRKPNGYVGDGTEARPVEINFQPESLGKTFDADSFEFFSWNSESDGDLMEEELPLDDEYLGGRAEHVIDRPQIHGAGKGLRLPFNPANSHLLNPLPLNYNGNRTINDTHDISDINFINSPTHIQNQNQNQIPNDISASALSPSNWSTASMDLGLRNNNNSGNSSERYSRGRGKFFGGKSLKLSSVNVNVKQESPLGQNPFFIPSPASISVFGFPDDSIGRQVDASPVGLVSILDFSPTEGPATGGVKVLICLGSPLHRPTALSILMPRPHSYSDVMEGLIVSFGGILVPCEVLSPTVLRCLSPPTGSSGMQKCQIWVLSKGGQVLNAPFPTMFHFLQGLPLPPPPVYIKLENMSMKRNQNLNSRGAMPYNQSTAAKPVQQIYQFDSREHKLRIVERLGTVGNALQSEVCLGQYQQFKGQVTEPRTGSDQQRTHTGSQTTASGTEKSPSAPDLRDGCSPVPPVAAFQWLDDQQLGALTTAELEDVMDRYLLSVVQQLVQQVSVDDDLRAELDSLDASGLSLLHYCCLYNLTALVLVLLNRGAHVDQLTGPGGGGPQGADVGSTALHLAAGAGHLPVVKMLIEYEAYVYSLDQQGQTPLDRAELGEHWEILDLLHSTAASKGLGPPRILPGDRRSSWSSTGDSALSPSSVTEQPGFPFSQPYNSTTFSSAAQDHPVGSSVPLSSSILAQHQHALPQPHHTSRHDGHPFSPLEDEGSISTLGGDNNFFDFPGSPRSPSLTPQTQTHKRPDNASSTERLMLQDAFSSLCLADKCALSVSLGPHCQSGRKMSPSVSSGSWESQVGHPSSPCRGVKEALEQHTNEFLSTTVPNKPSLKPVKLEILTAFSYPGERSDREGTNGSMSDVYVSPKHATFVQNRSVSMGVISGVGSDPDPDCSIESMGMQSVISQSDKVSLDVAMSMMGQQELDQVEDEVRKIQVNVRGWLLRKNYVNLRDAAKTLQVASREKRDQIRSGGVGSGVGIGIGAGAGTHRQLIESENGLGLHLIPMAKNTDPSTSISRESTRDTVSMSISRSPSPSRSPPGDRLVSQSSSSYSRAPHGPIVLMSQACTSTSSPLDSMSSSQRAYNLKNNSTCTADEREMHAAATLQAATRAMLARKRSFTHAKRQALASLVIQKSFLHWWVSKDPSNGKSGDDTGRKRKEFM